MVKIVVAWLIFCLLAPIVDYKISEKDEYIKQLEQNNVEQAEEKEVYINRCKMYEDFINQNGLVDNCDCR